MTSYTSNHNVYMVSIHSWVLEKFSQQLSISVFTRNSPTQALSTLSPYLVCIVCGMSLLHPFTFLLFVRLVYTCKYVNMICIYTGNSRNYLTIQESRIRRFKLFESACLNDVNELMQLVSKFRDFHRAVVKGK